MKGWGPKVKPGKPNFLGGISRHFVGISPGHPKSLKNKRNCGQIWAPVQGLLRSEKRLIHLKF